jgi:molybdopterin-containing oxidoreductase family iron-sulfur binding subunit
MAFADKFGAGKHRFGMLIDLDKCTGCGACTVACMAENNIGVNYDETDKLRSIAWMRLYQVDNGKAFPETEVAFFPRPCLHCEGEHGHHTPCVSVCPATATDYDEETGIVSQVPTRCIGCRYCVAACPYHARSVNWFDVPWPGGMDRGLSPLVSPRMRGVVEKCTFCFHRYQQAKNKAFINGGEIAEKDYQTACTQACPSGAIVFGDMRNPEHTITKLLAANPGAFRLLERLGTNNKVFYLTKRDWVRRLADNYLAHEKLPEVKAG